VARIVILLLIIASAAMFFVVLKAPPGSLFYQGPVQSETPAVTPVKAGARRGAADRKRETPRTRIGASSAQTGSHEASTAGVASPTLNTGNPSSAEQAKQIIWSVSSDSAAIYSTNSSRGPVLQILKKGDVVRSNLEVLAAGERWILVEVQNQKQNVSGFVRQDSVARKLR
jgi:hypothetical protein